MRFAPPVTLLLFLVPILCGLCAVLLPAFGYFPALGLHAFSLVPMRELFETPFLVSSVVFTIRCGFLATVISCVIVFSVFCSFAHGKVIGFLRLLLAPLLSVPHAAVALGIGFLFAPSGWLLRLISPQITGFTEPPFWLTNPDPYGLLYVLALVIKEVPFLFLIALASQNADNSQKALLTAQGLGYPRREAFYHVILPELYRRMRLPIYTVLAFSLSNLEVALTLAPSRPPLFSRLLLDIYNDPDLLKQTVAASAAFVQVLIVLLAIAIWRVGELLVFNIRRQRLERGRYKGCNFFSRIPSKILCSHEVRKHRLLLGRAKIRQSKYTHQHKLAQYNFGDVLAGASSVGLCILGILAIVLLPIWSFAKVWRFPASLPQEWSAELWLESLMRIIEPWNTSLVIALSASTCALLLCVFCLEQETRSKNRLARTYSNKALLAIYLPLVIPQISFLLGIQILLFSFSVPVTMLVVIWSHMLFVLPYIFLSLGDNWRGLDQRYQLTAQTLGSNRNRTMLFVTLPMLLKPLLTAFALGIAVSIALYAPTVLIGAGRFPTITSEAVALASGGDRRLLGAFAFLQATTPCLFFALALLIPRIVWRKYAFMAGG